MCVKAIHEGSTDANPERWEVTQAILVAEISKAKKVQSEEKGKNRGKIGFGRDLERLLHCNNLMGNSSCQKKSAHMPQLLQRHHPYRRRRNTSVNIPITSSSMRPGSGTAISV